MNDKNGKLALKFLGVSLKLQVLKSGAGYYIGTFDPLRGPVSRESAEYWASEATARKAMNSGVWTQRHEP